MNRAQCGAPGYSGAMEVRMWQSFSCNNSSNYYLVASFASSGEAEDVGGEVRAFLATHAKEKDAILDEGADDWDAAIAQPSPAQTALAEKHGFAWPEDPIFWGDDSLEGDEPSALAVGNKVLVYHSYCAGGLDFLEPFLKARGGLEFDSEMDSPMAAAILSLADSDEGAAVRTALDGFFAQRGTTEYMDEWDGAVFGTENPMHTEDDELFVWSNAAHYAFSMQVDDDTVVGLRKLAEGPGVLSLRLAITDEPLRETVRQLSHVASCPECSSDKMKYVAADDQTPQDQVACTGCGGMFPLKELAAPAPSED